MLFEILSQFCSAPYSSYTYLDSRTNKNYSSLTLRTRSLPLFTEYYKLFYLNGVKVIPTNIGDLLTPLSLIICSNLYLPSNNVPFFRQSLLILS